MEEKDLTEYKNTIKIGDEITPIDWSNTTLKWEVSKSPFTLLDYLLRPELLYPEKKKEDTKHMTLANVLFIDGPWDGRIEAINVDNGYFQVEGENKEEDPISYTLFDYKLHMFHTSGGVFYFGTLEGTSDFDIMERLVDCYFKDSQDEQK